jgi:hypothetical protein
MRTSGDAEGLCLLHSLLFLVVLAHQIHARQSSRKMKMIAPMERENPTHLTADIDFSASMRYMPRMFLS